LLEEPQPQANAPSAGRDSCRNVRREAFIRASLSRAFELLFNQVQLWAASWAPQAKQTKQPPPKAPEDFTEW
jgi:hypothetical protein